MTSIHIYRHCNGHHRFRVRTAGGEGGLETSCTLYWGYKVIYSNNVRIRLHYYLLNLHLQYAVLSIIIYFTFTFTLYN